MADAGVPVHVLREIAGHGSLTTTQRYLHPDMQSITDAGEALSLHLSVRRSPNGPQLRAVGSTRCAAMLDANKPADLAKAKIGGLSCRCRDGGI